MTGTPSEKKSLAAEKEKKGGVLVVILVTGLLLTDPGDFSRTKAH